MPLIQDRRLCRRRTSTSCGCWLRLGLGFGVCGSAWGLGFAVIPGVMIYGVGCWLKVTVGFGVWG